MQSTLTSSPFYLESIDGRFFGGEGGCERSKLISLPIKGFVRFIEHRKARSPGIAGSHRNRLAVDTIAVEKGF